MHELLKPFVRDAIGKNSNGLGKLLFLVIVYMLFVLLIICIFVVGPA